MRTSTRLVLLTTLLAGAVLPSAAVQGAPTGEAAKPDDNGADSGGKSGGTVKVDPSKAEGSNGQRTGEAPGSSGTPRGTAAPR